LLSRFQLRNYQVLVGTIAITAVAVVLAFWKPTVLIYGVQRAGLYAAVALPMALILGVVHIINLAHGDFIMLAAYIVYFLSLSTGLDPLVGMLPLFLIMGLIGMLVYMSTVKYILKAPLLSQLLLMFGIAMILQQLANLLWTSQPRKLHVGYVTASASIGSVTFGVYDFIFMGVAIIMLTGLILFLKRTRMGQAAVAAGQNPRGAQLVGINVNRTYLVIFSLSIALVGILGAIFATRYSIFPTIGLPFGLKSFALIAMAGIGNLSGLLLAGLVLGLGESFIMSFRGYGGWADIVFFALIFIVIVVRSYRRQAI
jgi:branched-chain amino acid transport system permease protein